MAGSKNLGALYGQIGADTSQWDRAMKGVHNDLRRIEAAGLRATQRISSSFKTAGRSMQRVGRSMNRYVTLPLLAAGGAAVKFSSDFNDSLAEARAQADLTGQQVSFIGDAASETAIATGEATADIIEAYKFTISAGQDLAASQRIVTAAAEASAAGFGQQRDLVRLTTTAMQAYNEEIDNGRQFMDLLVGSAQVMELEVSKLGPAFQRNVGVAKQLNIGMEELLAGIGSVSEIMGDATRGGRLFQTMITKLLSPTGEAKEVIAEVFGSLREMHSSIAEEGLLSTMVRLREETEAMSDEGLGLVFSQRSLEAALNFTNREGERTMEIMENMGDTTGSTNDAFQDSITFTTRLSRTWEALQAAMRPVGNVLLDALNPALDKATDFLADMAEVLGNVNPKVIQMGAVIGGLVATIGPLLSALGFMSIGIGGLVSAFGMMISAATGVVGFFASLSWPVVLGVAGAAAAATAIVTNWEEIVSFFEGEGSRFLEPVQQVFHSFVRFVKSRLTVARGIFQAWFKAMGAWWNTFGGLIVTTIKDTFSVAVNVLGAGLEAFSVLLDVWSGRFLTDWDGFLADTKSAFTDVFGEGGFLREAFSSWWEWFSDLQLRFNPMFVIGNAISDLLGVEGPLNTAQREAKERSKQNRKQIEGIYQGLADSLKNMDVSIGLPDFGSMFGGGGAEEPAAPSGDNIIPFVDSIMGASEGYRRSLEDMKAATTEFSGQSISDFAVVESGWENFVNSFKTVGRDFNEFIASEVSAAFQQLGKDIGMALAGTEQQWRTAFEKIIGIVLDFANTLGKILIAIGSAMALTGILSGPGGLYIAAGTALVALATGFEAGIEKRARNRQQRAQEMEQQTRSVGDALITSQGEVIEFAPNDDILAAPGLGDTVRSMGVSGSGERQIIENHLYVDGRELEVILEEIKKERLR